MNFIGFTGYAQVGKDSAGEALVDTFGYRRVAFADKVKEYALEVNPVIPVFDELDRSEKYLKYERLADLIDLYGWDAVKQIRFVREMLVAIGRTSREIHGPNAWTDPVEAHLPIRVSVSTDDLSYSLHEPIVITDVRYNNEAKMIRHYGGKVIRINRPDYGPVVEEEKSVDEIEPDAVIANDSTLHDFKCKVTDVVRMLKKNVE